MARPASSTRWRATACCRAAFARDAPEVPHARGSTRSIVGVVAAGFAGFMSLDFAGRYLTNVGTLAAFMLVCLTVVYLRVTQPNAEPSVQAPTWADHHHCRAWRH
jgi:hypothetical protein